MKIKVLFVSVLAFALAVGCQEDEKGEKMSPLGVEEHKANLEQSGLNVVDKMDAMSDMEALHVVNEFVSLIENTSGEESGIVSEQSGVVTVMKSVGEFENGMEAAVNLKSTTVDNTTLAGEFDQEAGIYTYDPETQSWIKGESGDQITYHFPVNGSETNNATISVTNFSAFTTTNPDLAEVEDLLESVNISLTVNEEQLILFEFEASYDENDIPESITESLTLGKYIIETSVEKDNSTMAFEQSFEFDGNNIISYHFESNGEFTYDNIEDNTSEEPNPFDQSVVNSANSWVAVDNLKLEGTIDWKGFQNDAGNIDEDSFESEQVWVETLAGLINNNASIELKYNDSNEIIAVGEAYSADSDEGWELDFRVKFSDGSYMDDSFFGEENFTDFVNSVDEMINEVETNYGMSE
ncbi:hypothetical protein [Marinilabilia rubra]|uniref:Uncharacterized protein n=1 Tax=Marinilabilia rubra TaxID=2162893 RepID=A0A2U2B845_9BACT|nr:hypothetical protein [Marinilabilia rubra]PWD99238.1 hypothetical protein DDZ16_11620 [Marinilabilia rubra]